MKQLDHHDTMKKMPKLKNNLYLFLCGISFENLGLIMRSADAFGAKGIIYYSPQFEAEMFSNKKMQKAARNSTIPVEFTSDYSKLDVAAERGYSKVALEITDTSQPLRKANWNDKTILVVGNERTGIPQEILEKIDTSIHIEMTGSNISSLNVAIATSIALNDYSEKLLEKGEKNHQNNERE